MKHLNLAGAAAFLALAPSVAAAHDPTVEGAELRPETDGWFVAVTLRHSETGWDEYADGWRVEARDGTILGVRPLAHPHADEQPFTRSTTGVRISNDMQTVFIRARTNTGGWAKNRVEVPVPR